MRKTAKDIRREETRARLLEAAKRLFSEYGYDAVPVTEIARQAGVTHAMINVYFGGKPGLLYKIVRETNAVQFLEIQEIVEAEGDPLDRLEDLLLSWVAGDTQDTRLLSVMQSYAWVWSAETEEDNRSVRAFFKDAVSRIIQQGQATGRFRPGIDPDLAARSIWAIYTWGTRATIFEGATTVQCLSGIMAQVRQLLLPDP